MYVQRLQVSDYVFNRTSTASRLLAPLQWYSSCKLSVKNTDDRNHRDAMNKKDPEYEKLLLTWGVASESSSPKLLKQWHHLHVSERGNYRRCRVTKPSTVKLTLVQSCTERGILD
jgi:hypothetical protein